MRVSFDLDEVLFVSPQTHKTEPALPFPLNRIYKERIRLGIPALFHALRGRGYDIWIYTAGYYSLDYLKYYFRHYRVPVTGIVTGTARKAPAGSGILKELEKLAACNGGSLDVVFLLPAVGLVEDLLEGNGSLGRCSHRQKDREGSEDTFHSR